MVGAEIVEAVVAALRPYEPERVILFGSWARGEADAESDLDLVIIKETEEPFRHRLGELPGLELPLAARDIFVYTPGEFQEMWEKGNPFIEAVVEEGVVIYERPGTEQRSLVQGRCGVKRDPKEEAQRWLNQAQDDLALARELAGLGHHAAACFYCQQAGEKALKAYLYRQGLRRVLGHSVLELCERCATYDLAFGAIQRRAGKLDRFYAQTRYPNALPGGIPALAFDEEDSAFAMAIATAVIDLVKERLEGEERGDH